MTINVLSELPLRPEREDIIISAWKPLYFACEIMQNNDVQWNINLQPWKMKILRNFHFANKGPCRIVSENWIGLVLINNSMLAYRVVCCSHQSDRLGYVSRTNQIAALGYVSRTNHIIAFEYPAPITAFGYFFSCKWCHRSKNDISQKFWAHLVSVMVCGLRESLVD